MAVIKCKMCGGNLILTEGQSVAECDSCGGLQTVPSADNEKKLNLFASAHKLRASCEFDRAAGIYEAIKAEFPSEAEAYWGLVLCKYGIEYVDDPATGRKVPTCHRVSYDSVMDDANLDMALDCADVVARKVYREEAKQLERIREGILEVSSNEKPYDIFICYKETDENGDRTLDSVLAQDLYTALTDKGYRVFFARITLQSKLGEAYEPYIFAALNSARVMLAVGTDPEYYGAVWVKNEWSRYLKICAADKSRHLIPCYKDMDAYDMPREFRPLQGVDLGKMGAVQDILFNMEKYIPLKKQNTTVIQEKVVVGGTGGRNKIASLLDRGNMALEDGDWAKADSFFEDVLNNDSKNAQAYIGKTLALERCRTMDALVRKRKDVYQNVRSEMLQIPKKEAHIADALERFSLPGYVQEETLRALYDFDRSYTSEVSHRQKQYREEENWWQNHRQLSRAEKFASGAVAEHLHNEKGHLFSQLADRVKKAQEADARNVARLEAAYDAHIAEADAKAEKMHSDALTRREKDYQRWLGIAKTSENVDQLYQAVTFFDAWIDYKDSKNLAQHCRKRINDIKAELKRKEAERKAAEAAEAERRRIAEAKAAAARKKRNTIIAIIAGITAAAIIGVTLLMTMVILPGNKYKAAEVLLAEGKTAQAAMAFGRLGNYQDARERSFELWDQIAQRKTICASYRSIVSIQNDGTAVPFYENWIDIIAVTAGSSHFVGLRGDGTVVASGDNGFGQCDVSGWRDIVAISAGGGTSMGLRSDGTVVCTNGPDTVTGDGKPVPNGLEKVRSWTDIVAIYADGTFAAGIRSDGTVVTTYYDVSDWTDIVAIGHIEGRVIGLRSNGTVVVTLNKEPHRTDIASEARNWTDIVEISTSDHYLLGLKGDGTVLTASDGFSYSADIQEYGASFKRSDIVAIEASYNCGVGLCSDGTVEIAVESEDKLDDVYELAYKWADLMIPSDRKDMVSAVQEKLSLEAQALEKQNSEQYARAEALLTEGKTAEAAIAFSKLGDYQDSKERCFALWDAITKPETFGAGWLHAVGLCNDGTVVATGPNDYGQCNVSDWADIVAVSAGWDHTVGLRKDGTVVAVGENHGGQCDVEDWTDIIAVSAGAGHSVGLHIDGTVVATGHNDHGQCDVGDWSDIVAVSAGDSYTVGLKADGTVVAVGYNGDGQCNVSDWRDIVAVHAELYHTVGLRSDGTVVAVGDIYSGMSDIYNWTDIIAVSAGWDHTVGLRSDGTVVAAGNNFEGQCDVENWTGIVAVSAGSYYTLGLRSDGTVAALGTNLYASDDVVSVDISSNVSDWKNIKLPN